MTDDARLSRLDAWVARPLRILLTAIGILLGMCPAAPPAAAQSPASDWSQVIRLRRGSDVIVTTTSQARSRQILVTADESSLLVVDTPAAALPNDIRKRVQRAARERPTDFVLLRAGRPLQLEKGLRLSPEGVFEADRRVADLERLLWSIPRGSVREVSVPRKHVGSHTRRGALIGAAAGAVMLTACGSYCGPAAARAAFGAAVGVAAGAFYGSIVGLAVPRSPDVIYQAPAAN